MSYGRLYPLLLVSVLSVCGCGNGDSGKEPDPPSASQQATPAGNGRATGATVLFFGDSITAGYGLSPDQAFPALIAERAERDGLPVRVINAGLSGETSAAGVRRIGWVLRERVDVFVLELGGNDALRGVDLEATRHNLQAIIDTVRTRNPRTRVIVAGMMIPPNFGRGYARTFREIYPGLAEENDAVLIPFILEGVAAVNGMMQYDGIHPTSDGHEVVAETVWRYLEPELVSVLSGDGA